MRSPDEFPTQSPMMRYGSPYPRKTSHKAPPNFVAAIKNADNEGAEKLETLLTRKNKFCGGMSKPYKKK